MILTYATSVPQIKTGMKLISCDNNNYDDDDDTLIMLSTYGAFRG